MDRMRSEKSMDFGGFTDLIYKLLKAAWGTEWGTFTEAFPIGREPNNVTLPIITYQMTGKTPGQVGKNTRELKPRYREHYLPSETGEDVAYVNFAQVFDYQITFKVFTPSHKETRELMERFEDFMFTYTGFMMQEGARQLYFDSLHDIPAPDIWRDEVVGQEMRYLVQLEKQILVPSSAIKEVIGTVTPVQDLESGRSLSNDINTITFHKGGTN